MTTTPGGFAPRPPNRESVLARLRQHPRGFWFIFWGELAERSSFYGMRTVLALYLTQILGFEEANAATTMHAFIAACYLAPLLGGVIADRVLGRYRTILYFSPPYILGHLILGGFENRTALVIALTLLALGSGSIKPNTSTLMGMMYEEQKKDALLSEAFSYFYAAINIGAAISQLGLPMVREYVTGRTGSLPQGYAVALMIPAVLMAAAFVLFALGKKHYPAEQVKARPPRTPEQRAAERETLGRIAGIFLLIVVFWFVYDETASTWIYFAQKQMDLNLIPGITISPDQVQGLNPVFILVLTPFFNWLWEFLKARRGAEVPETRKMLLGFFIVIACMGTMAISAFLSETSKVSVWWMCIATFVITMAELCISVVGMEFAFKQAVPGTKSFVTGVFWLTVFGGNIAAGYFDHELWGKISSGLFFSIQTAICAAATACFWVIARRFEQSAGAAPASAAPARTVSQVS